jgi:hypothetical protein
MGPKLDLIPPSPMKTATLTHGKRGRGWSSVYCWRPPFFLAPVTDLGVTFLEGKNLRKEPLSERRKLLLRSSKKLPRISDSPKGCRALKKICYESLKSSASRDWSPKSQIHFTKAAGAAAPGSNSRSLSLKSSLSAGTHCPKEAGATSARCWSATKV